MSISTVTVGVNDFVKRQTADSKFSYFKGTWEEAVNLVQQALPEGKPGYRDGVLVVPVAPEGFFTNVVTLKDGDVLSGSFASRRDGEAPRKEFTVVREGASSQPAKSVDVILYRKDVLAEDGDNTTDADWEIISINAHPCEGEVPIHPDVLTANHFGLDGGTATNMSDQEYCAQMEISVQFWANKAQLDPGQ